MFSNKTYKNQNTVLILEVSSFQTKLGLAGMEKPLVISELVGL